MKRTARIWLLGPYVAIGVGLLIMRNAWATVCGFHGIMLAALWLHRRRWRVDALWGGGRPSWLPAIVLSVLAFGYGLTQLAGLFPGYGRHLRIVLNSLSLSGAGMGALGAYLCLVNPVIEEAFWRGLFFEGRKRLALSDLAYGGVHFLVFLPFMFSHYALIAAAFLSAMGYLWRRIASQQKGLAMPIAWHALGDASIILSVAVILR